MEIGLSLGSNIDDRLSHLQQAATAIALIPDVRIVNRSPVYETEPVDVPPEYRQLSFLNAILILESERSPDELSVAAHEIENQLGRQRGTERNEPRPIDIDLIYAGNLTLHTATVTLPHPRWAERRFVVQPLADIRPGLILPGQSHSVGEILSALPPSPIATLFATDW